MTSHSKLEKIVREQASPFLKLEHAMPILLVVWSANGDGSALPHDNTNRYVCAGMCNTSGEIEQGVHYIRNLLDEESVSGEAVVKLVYKFDKKYYLECLKR